MEIAPELQFKHYTVAEAQLPADALMQIPSLARRRRDLLRPRAHVFYARTPTRGSPRRSGGTHWFEVREWTTQLDPALGWWEQTPSHHEPGSS